MNLLCCSLFLHAICAPSVARFSTGTTPIAATCHGATKAWVAHNCLASAIVGCREIPTPSGSPRSCCNKPAWPPFSITTRDGCSAFQPSQDLAKAREQSVLALWSGLGYYHRARRLHQAAKLIARERKGEFPTHRRSMARASRHRTLHGRCHRQHCFRTNLSRSSTATSSAFSTACSDPLTGREGNWQRAEALLDRTRPGDFNQAMMELGATICTPRAPQCLVCPLITWCATRGADAPKPQPARKRRQLHYALARQGNSILLVQRPADATRMAGMWELPEIAADSTATSAGEIPPLHHRHRLRRLRNPRAPGTHPQSRRQRSLVHPQAVAEAGPHRIDPQGSAQTRACDLRPRTAI